MNHIKASMLLAMSVPLLAGSPLWAQVNVNDPSLRPNVPLNQVAKPLSQDKKAVPIDDAKQKENQEYQDALRNPQKHPDVYQNRPVQAVPPNQTQTNQPPVNQPQQNGNGGG